jgi:maltooligosyltrehalose synthase
MLPMPRSNYRNVFTGNEHDASEGYVSLAELFANFPVALLEKI